MIRTALRWIGYRSCGYDRIVRDAELPNPPPRRHLMAMPVSIPTYTTDDLRAFPHDGCRYELLDGMLLVTPAPGTRHQNVLARVQFALTRYVGLDGPARVVSPGEIEIAPRVLLDPDVLVYPASCLPGTGWTEIRGWWLAVEVLSRSSRRYDRDFKRDAYLALGVREVWLVDLDTRCVLVSTSRDAPRDVRHGKRLVWHPPEMLEPLALDIPLLFEGVV